jgi:hypothetical protein
MTARCQRHQGSESRSQRLPLADLWARYRAWKELSPVAEQVVLQDYFDDGSGKAPRYYQVNAVNATIEAIAKGQDRILLVMATGTGKTYTAFQIIWRLWKAGAKKRILFLADRNVLIDQTMVNDFRPFGPAMAKLSTNAKGIKLNDGATVDLPLALDKKRRLGPPHWREGHDERPAPEGSGAKDAPWVGGADQGGKERGRPELWLSSRTGGDGERRGQHRGSRDR